MLFERKLSIGHDGIIIGIVRFDDTDAKKKKILRVRSTDSWTCRNYADLNIRKEEMKGREIYGANVEYKLLIVDHNFTTIFRQPDGSAG